MYIPNTVPQSLEEMMEFLQPTIEDGLFDAIEYDNVSSPPRIICKQNEDKIFETYMDYGQWYFIPYIGGAQSDINHYSTMNLGFVARCKGGIMFRSTFQGGPYYYNNFVIGKTNTGKTGFIQFNRINKYSHTSVGYYTTCFEDDTSSYLYQYGYLVGINYSNDTTTDRTILTTIPVNGRTGIIDYFETVKIRTLVQFVETGVQIIDDKKYGCIDTIAILDEDLPTSNSTPNSNSESEPEPEQQPGE